MTMKRVDLDINGSFNGNIKRKTPLIAGKSKWTISSEIPMRIGRRSTTIERIV